MPRLVPLNGATCPHCSVRGAHRIGYSEKKRGSLWRCVATECAKVFLVPTMTLARPPAKSPAPG